MKLSKICSEIINYCFYLLFFTVPLFWLPVNSELFEFNKMILVYLLTTVIVTAWLIKGLSEKEFKIKRTPLDIPIVIFLIANIFSTIFSLDPHTSIFGYYGRWNGGLLSTIAYILLYYSLISNSDKKQVFYYLWTTLFSGFLVSIYAILQHPNPLFREKIGQTTILHGIDYNYWAVDVENRVFSTFGQPNWLAAFLAMIIFPLISFLLVIKRLWQKLIVFLAIVAFYIAFTFTFSRGGTVGILFGAATFVLVLPFYKETLWNKVLTKIPVADLNFFWKKIKNYSGVFLALLALVLIVNYFFGNAISLRGGLTTQANQTTTQTQNSPTAAKQTQLEVGGTQTATIRTIVWTGTIEIFKHYPILGSGVETFGYSYYLFRPAAHNLTAEWDYLYNKAHNEYLNYLATTGAFGFLSYLFLIGLFEFLALKIIFKSSWSETRFISIGLLAGYNSYLAQNFFGFSVVPITVLFFIYPALFFIFNDSLNNKFLTLFSTKNWAFLSSKLANTALKVCVLIIAFAVTISVLSFWLADYYYNRGTSSGNYQDSIKYLRVAVNLSPGEPLYQAELASNLAGYAAAADNKNTIRDSKLEAKELINKALNQHPNNTALWQTKRIVDYTLSKIDKAFYLDLIKDADTLKRLAPTDASIQYDVALVYSFVDKNDRAEKQLEEVVKLKSDYQEATVMLARIYQQNGKKPQAIKTLNDWLKNHPTDSEAADLLKTFTTN